MDIVIKSAHEQKSTITTQSFCPISNEHDAAEIFKFLMKIVPSRTYSNIAELIKFEQYTHSSVDDCLRTWGKLPKPLRPYTKEEAAKYLLGNKIGHETKDLAGVVELVGLTHAIVALEGGRTSLPMNVTYKALAEEWRYPAHVLSENQFTRCGVVEL